MSTKKVVIYSTPWCGYCQLAKQFFANNQVEYTEHNVQDDVAKRQEMVDKSGQLGVPVIAISDEAGGEKVVIGFDQPELINLLGL